MLHQQHQPLQPSYQQQGIEGSLGQQPQFGQPAGFQQPQLGQQPQFQQQPQPAIAAQGSQPTAQQVPAQPTTQQSTTQPTAQYVPVQPTTQQTSQVSPQQTSQVPLQTVQTPQQTTRIPQQTAQPSNLAVPGTTQQGSQFVPQQTGLTAQPFPQTQTSQALQPVQTSQAQIPQTAGRQMPTGQQIPPDQRMPASQQLPAQQPSGQGTASPLGQQVPQQIRLGTQGTGQPVGVAASPSGQSLGPGAGSLTAQTQGMQAGTVGQVSEQAQQELAGTPSLDMVDTPDEIVLFVDLPGFDEEDIRIQADGQNLTISAERREDEPDEGQKLARERPLKLQRTIRLPSRANVNEADATYENGVCKITLPKMEEEKQHEIAFQ